MAKSEAEWRGIFKQFDKDGSGCVTIQELKAGLKEQYGCDVSDADVTVSRKFVSWYVLRLSFHIRCVEVF